MTIKRINREINDLKKEDLGDIRLAPSEASMLEWTGAIPGPTGSVYEGGLFEFSLTLPSDYPFTAPKITFKTRIYHMNISQTGHICLDILKNAWSPALSIFKVILSLSSLLTDPNPSDPLVPPIATEYTRKRAQHDQTARLWTQLYAIASPKGKSHPTIDLTASTRPHLPGIAASEPARTVSSTPTTTFSRPRPVPLAAVSSRTIDLSDDEADATAVTSSPGTIVLPGSKRKRTGGDASNPSPRSRRRRTADRPEEGFATTGASGSLPGTVASTGRRAREVIVIDDD
ncbi:hypothetical protein BS47DRAFT_1409189 [Hydnum rufescens UP504]|uniref:E2 ubiquitin-conjugating enzyme n=1 Tax=Hydnum rufescens UP504 TaxID=1448309 RepID=A0A9P6DPP6_9AGAM|nr:hypothetical protein BS47DRAFT_1409189 [Hydnum rufescens UP504]